MKDFILWLLAIVCVADSFFRAKNSNLNLGTGLMYIISVLVCVYALFHRQIDAFCAVGIGAVFKWLFFLGCAFLCLCMVFLSIAGKSGTVTKTEKAVIVLGAGLLGEQVSSVLRHRLDTAVALYRENPKILIVVTGGQGKNELIPEANAMQNYLVKQGIPIENILLEDKSTSTQENFIFAKNVLALHGVSSSADLLFVTNRFHCYRASLYAKNAGFLDIQPVAAGISATSVLPCYLREVFALAYYLIFNRTA